MPLKCPYCWRCFRYSLSRDMHIKDDHRIVSGRCLTGQADGGYKNMFGIKITYVLGTATWAPITEKHLQLTRKQNQYSNRRRTQHHQNSAPIHSNQKTENDSRKLFYYGRENIEETNTVHAERDHEEHRELEREHRSMDGQRGQRGQSEEDSPGSTDSCDSEQNNHGMEKQNSQMPNSDAAIRVSVIVKNPFI